MRHTRLASAITWLAKQAARWRRPCRQERRRSRPADSGDRAGTFDTGRPAIAGIDAQQVHHVAEVDAAVAISISTSPAPGVRRMAGAQRRSSSVLELARARLKGGLGLAVSGRARSWGATACRYGRRGPYGPRRGDGRRHVAFEIEQQRPKLGPLLRQRGDEADQRGVSGQGPCRPRSWPAGRARRAGRHRLQRRERQRGLASRRFPDRHRCGSRSRSAFRCRTAPPARRCR